MNDRKQHALPRSAPGRHGMRSEWSEPQYSSAEDETYGSEWSRDDAPQEPDPARPPEGIGQQPGAGTGFDPGHGVSADQRPSEEAGERPSEDDPDGPLPART